jgi:EAL domain-containing protein (putative c-di-GMP-specific phosphodiesterase class I)/CheY-like chemotaxis protein
MSHPRTGESATATRLAFVFDDEPAIAELLADMLARIGFSGYQFSSAAPFLVAVKSRPPDLIILDLALDQTDGVEVLRALGKLDFAGSVLLISGKDPQVLMEVFEIGIMRGLAMLPPLHKPFFFPDLQQALMCTATTRTKPSQREARQPPWIDLSEALERGWLELWYQPKIDLKARRICGAEALLRARHPDLGVLLPSSFLPGSDDPLHQPLFEFVLQDVSKHAFRLVEMNAPLRLSFNAPASVLYGGNLVGLVRRNVPDHPGFPGLLLEITEDEIIREPELAREVAAQMKLRNVLLSIDDFGAGSASFSRLRELPAYELKLDRAFVDGCSEQRTNRAACDAAVSLGHEFNALVCAEGVERAADLRVLRELGFDSAQGLLFAQPMPFPKFMQLLASQASAA